MKLRNWSIFAASAIVGGALVLPLNADAFGRRVHAAACFVTGPFFSQGGGFGIQNISAQQQQVECSVPDDDSLLPQNMTTVNVHAINNTGGPNGFVGATACTVFRDVGGGSCQFSASSNMVGSVTLQPPHATVWASTAFNQFKYVSVILPPQAWLKGLFFSNN